MERKGAIGSSGTVWKWGMEGGEERGWVSV